jgi:hypothetical protein
MPNKNHGRIIEIRMIAPMIEDEVPMNILRESAIRVSIKSRRITTTYRPVSCRWCQCLCQWYEYHTRPIKKQTFRETIHYTTEGLSIGQYKIAT